MPFEPIGVLMSVEIVTVGKLGNGSVLMVLELVLLFFSSSVIIFPSSVLSSLLLCFPSPLLLFFPTSFVSLTTYRFRDLDFDFKPRDLPSVNTVSLPVPIGSPNDFFIIRSL